MVAVIAPVVAALVVAVAAAGLHRRLPPAVAARSILVAVWMVVVAGLASLWLIGFGFVAQHVVSGGRLEWCAESIGVHGRVPFVVGLVALALAVVGPVRAVRHYLRSRSMRVADAVGVRIADDARLFAYTLPGPGGAVVVSTAMRDALSDAELQVVLAHEHAHATHRHDRMFLTARLACVLMPLVRPLTRRLEHTLERWADEDAARACGDRRLVATTLGRVALRAQVSPPWAALPAGLAGLGGVGSGGAGWAWLGGARSGGAWSGGAGLGVPERVRALLQPPVSAPSARARVLLGAAVVVVAVASVYQLHHVGVLIVALCQH